jgi:hypothetical protein
MNERVGVPRSTPAMGEFPDFISELGFAGSPIDWRLFYLVTQSSPSLHVQD